MSIKVKNYTSNQDNNSSVVGFVSFFIPEWGLHLNSCKYIRNKDGGFFIGFPSKEKDDKFFPYFCFEGNAGKRFQEAAKKAIEDHISKLSEPEIDFEEFQLF